MSIAQGILDIVDEYMTKENGRKLMEVAVEVGELTAVVPDSLTFCFEALVENSPYQDSKISINIIPLTGTCSDCGNSFKIKNFEFVCPDCQSTGIGVNGGQELRISHLEVE
jgi:hydrogenase nickel incorporation protein HypA/HybF